MSDSEYMEGMLQAYGYKFTDKKDDADLWCVRCPVVHAIAGAACVACVAGVAAI